MPVPHGPRHHPIRRSWSANIPLTERSAHRDGERLGGEIEMQSYVKRKATDRGGALGIAACVSLILRSEEHTSELQSLMRISYAVFCLKNKKYIDNNSSSYVTNNIPT